VGRFLAAVVNFTPAQILADDSASVLITSFTLSMWLTGTGSKLASLHRYAGSAARPENKPIPGQWVMYGRRPRCKRNLTISEAFGCGHVFGL
jgi:hypothetical protein